MKNTFVGDRMVRRQLKRRWSEQRSKLRRVARLVLVGGALVFIWHGRGSAHTRGDVSSKMRLETTTQKTESISGVGDHQERANDDLSMIQEIVARWNLTSPRAMELLAPQMYYLPLYDKKDDFIFFQHILKTGGTTLSMLLDQVLGGTMPGSQVSGPFDWKLARRNVSSLIDYKVAYGHANVRRSLEHEQDTDVTTFLKESLSSQRRIRVITMIREPVTLRASKMNMWLCQYDAFLRYNATSEIRNCNVTLSQLTDRRTLSLRQQCPQIYSIRKMAIERSNGKVIPEDTKYYKWCQSLNSGQDPFLECRSVRNLLDSKLYNQHFHHMHAHVLGRFTANQTTAVEADSISPEQVEDYVLTELGGGVGDEADDYDFVWFGITERMPESLCLLYYTLKVPAPVDIKKERFMYCRPTDWWFVSERREVERREPLDYALYRAANALMDVRLAEMRRQIQVDLDRGEELESTRMRHVGPGCFDNGA